MESVNEVKERVYIAGPMTGYPEYNYPAFMAAEKLLLKGGFEVVNPVRIGEKYGTAEELAANDELLDFVIEEELRELEHCDAIYLLRGWEGSIGARKELVRALEYKLRIILQREGA